ncbi:GNAT family N-acetyltransferase [Ahniella affigens]|uniref:GNAT family N-acetyltransferase n=1 Tax=Ahniella affigens TaxID=2021234 RepID=A0A2P1PUF4_9GAMM|nr:GNAT family N-acetyltransferase [Ahniella affigens]AVP98479.1 GNAT family N-acetyltransferase [Ahniella affigens]
MSTRTPTILIRTLQDPDHQAVQQLVLDILNIEYQMALSLQDLPDLSDLGTSYQPPAAQFWVATHHRRVVACIGVMPLGDGDFELRRMYVHQDFRGLGLAQRLLSVSLQWSRDHGVKSLYLETNTQWQAAQYLYGKHGFSRIDRSDLPAKFPVVRIATDFYRLHVSFAGTSIDPE